MDKEKIISGILERVGNTDVSPKTVESIMSLNPLSEGTEPDDAYFERMANTVKSVQGNINHVFSTKLSDQVAKKVAELKDKQQPEPKGKQKTEPTTSEPQNNSGGSDELREMREELRQLREERKADMLREHRREVLSDVRRELKEKLSSSGMEVRDFFVDTALSKLSIPEKDADVKALVTEAERNVVRDMKAAGIDTDGPISGGVRSNGGKSWLDMKFAEKAAREGYAHKQ